MYSIYMRMRRGLWALAGALAIPGGPLAAQADDITVDLLRRSVVEYRVMLGGEGLLDPCTVSSFFGNGDVRPSVPPGLGEYTYVWDQPCPFARAVGVRPTKLDVIDVVIGADSAAVHLERNNGHNEDPYTFVFRRAPDDGWMLDHIAVEPSMDRGLGRDREAAQLPVRALGAVATELGDGSLAVDRRLLAQFAADGLGLTGRVQLLSARDEDGQSSLDALPGGDFPAAVRCLVAQGSLGGEWVEMAAEAKVEGTCDPPRPEMVLIASTGVLDIPPDQAYRFRVRVYGAGPAGLRVWDVMLDHTFEVQEVRTLLIIP